MKEKLDNKKLQNKKENQKLDSRVNDIQDGILKRLSHYFKTKRGELPLRELNKLSGVSTSVIVDLEQKKSLPRIDTLIRLSLALAPNDIDNMFREMPENSDSDEYVTAERLLQRALIDLGLTHNDIVDVRRYIKYLRFCAEERKERQRQREQRQERENQSLNKPKPDKPDLGKPNEF